MEDEHSPKAASAAAEIVAVNNFRNTGTKKSRRKKNKNSNNKLDDIWEFQRVTRQTRIVFFFLFVASLVYIIREPLLAHLFNDNAQKRWLFKICTKMPELIE